jgi:hypothetical protein
MIKNASEKTVLELETLTKQYDIILKQYEQNIADYLSFLNEKNATDTFVSMRGQSYWGTKPLTTEKSNTLGKCKILCSSNKNCSGATYDQTTSQCFLRTGDSQTITSSDNYYAIISKNIFYLTTLQKLNDELTVINNKILEYTKQGYKLYDTINENKELQKNNLNKNYYKLAKEREIIVQKIKEHETINEDIKITGLKSSSNYYSYLFLILFAIVFVIFLIKFSIPETSFNVKLVFGFIILFMVFIYFFVL